MNNFTEDLPDFIKQHANVEYRQACRRCSNYIFVLNLTHGFNELGKDNYKMRREAFKFWDLVRLILETSRYITIETIGNTVQGCINE